MKLPWRTGLLCLLVGLPAFCGPDAIDRAFQRLYNFDFAGAHRILDEYQGANSSDPLAYGVRASTYLFQELYRLGILESEFFADYKRLTEKRNLKADPVIRQKLFKAMGEGRRLAQARLAAKADDDDALFTMCIVSGVLTDYTSFVEDKHLSSLSNAKEAQRWALALLKSDPTFYDAYLTTGISEYLVGSLPFFVRWFVRFDQVEGSKEQAVHNLELVASKGRYVGPFARILLAIIHLREKRPEVSHRILVELAREYPENPLIRREMEKIATMLPAIRPQPADGMGR